MPKNCPRECSVGAKMDQKSTQNHEKAPSKKHKKNDADKGEKKQEKRQFGRPGTMKSLIQLVLKQHFYKLDKS